MNGNEKGITCMQVLYISKLFLWNAMEIVMFSLKITVEIHLFYSIVALEC